MATYLRGAALCGTALEPSSHLTENKRCRTEHQDGLWSFTLPEAFFSCQAPSHDPALCILRTADSTLIEERPSVSPSPLARTEITLSGTEDSTSRRASKPCTSAVHSSPGVAVTCAVGLRDWTTHEDVIRCIGHLSRNQRDGLPSHLSAYVHQPSIFTALSDSQTLVCPKQKKVAVLATQSLREPLSCTSSWALFRRTHRGTTFSVRSFTITSTDSGKS